MGNSANVKSNSIKNNKRNGNNNNNNSNNPIYKRSSTRQIKILKNRCSIIRWDQIINPDGSSPFPIHNKSSDNSIVSDKDKNNNIYDATNKNDNNNDNINKN